MNPGNHKKQVNPIHLAPLARWLIAAVLMGCCGLFYVYMKNQQFALGEQIRQVERAVRETRAQNQVLSAQINRLSSRAELQRRIAEGFIKMTPIQDHCIARLTAPTIATSDGVMRTASNERFRQ